MNLNKKQQILEEWKKTPHSVLQLSERLGTRPGYVASVLQEAGLLAHYIDLYTSTSHPAHVYSEIFAGKLGFKDLPTSLDSVKIIAEAYSRMKEARDRAGQHHCMVMALTMFNRAQASGKRPEAALFRHWLMETLMESDRKPEPQEPIEIPWMQLNEDTLKKVIEEFVSREGTDYGMVEISFERKVEQVREQLRKGVVKIVFDAESESCDIREKKPFQ